jgi:fused signal recognition particle receptor|uniref:signal recognition particle-docking protein FtsY n=1 Tax=Candidatus Planktophila sp. TaxID=2175601 RepID=UPI004049B918
MALFTKLIARIKGNKGSDNSDWSELESELLQADLGPSLSAECIEQAKKLRTDSPQDSLLQFLASKLSTRSHEMNLSNATSTILVVGVNGTGKTTSVAKLASFYNSSGKSVLLAAGDTFRAAAVDQLKTWGARIDVPVISGQENGDPASVAFDAAKFAQTNNIEILIIDTAGRLHNKSDLMSELAKVKRVVEKTSPISEVLLVIDATTGQNGLMQAKIFAESVDVTGVILTKMDGSAKGGVALAIEAELDIPIKWIGSGESESDFSPFNPETYLKSLLS